MTQAIAVERANMGFQHDLLRETGNNLVTAVKTALAAMGFNSVVDSDELVQPGERRREDLQIHDRSPVLLVEIKGIAGLPPEHDAIQVGKYVAPRMKEWNRTDVAGLSIVNHQRNLPGLERDPAPFSNDVITNALDQGLGLLTAWDLFRLIRNFLQLRWKPDYVQSLFYTPGRIDAVPTHYELAGEVEHYWDRVGVVGIRITDASLHPGDRIAFQLPVDYFEQEVASLEVERQPVNEAPVGMLAGVKTQLPKGDARKGVRVFRIKRRD